MSTVKRKLTKISFDFDKAHLALTDKSAGGACSLMNTPILLKSLEEGKTLSIEQQSLLEAVGYDVSEVVKSMEEKTKSSTLEDIKSEREAEVENLDKSKQEGNDDNMSEQLKKEVIELRKELADTKTDKAIAKYEFEENLSKELIAALRELAEPEAIYKAMDYLVAKAKDAESELNKEKEVKDNPLAKALSEEVGESGEAEVKLEKSREEKIAEYLV